MPARLKLLFSCTAIVLVGMASNAMAVPVAVGNFSFEAPANGNAQGLYGALNNTQVWTGDGTGLHGFGFADLPSDDGTQNVSLREGAALTQEQNGGTVDGFTKASIPLPALSVGDQVSLTVAYALRDNASILWADSSFIALYDSSDFNLNDPLNTSLANSGFLSEPASRGVWVDQTVNYTITGDEGGFLGIYLRGEHLGAVVPPAGPANYQVFFDNVRLDVPEILVVPGDVDLDGDVDPVDFGIIRDNFLKTVNSRGEGDLNGDDIVDFADFQEVVDNYPFPPPAGGFASFLRTASVPEPSSALLVFFALCTGVAAKRSRR